MALALTNMCYNWRMNLTLLVKLDPTPDDHAALVATMTRFNAACDAIAIVAFREQTANKIRLQQIVYYDIRERFGLSAQMTVRAISKVCEAYKRDRTILPRFRSDGAIVYDQRIMGWKGLDRVSLLTLNGRIIVPIVVNSYHAPRLERIRGQADLVLRDGTFYLAAVVDVPTPPIEPPTDWLGVDLGVVNVAVDSDGTTYSGAAIESKRRIFGHRRRNLQRKGTHSARTKLRSIKRRQARYQRNENHRISKQLVARAKDTDRGLALEDLSGIRGRTTVRKPQRARLANWSFFQLRSFLGYKAELAGVKVIEVDPRYTSQTCPECGRVDRANRRSRASFHCVSCGFAAPADATAARNVRARATVMWPMVPDGALAPVSGTSPCASARGS
jgi:putative transposase